MRQPRRVFLALLAPFSLSVLSSNSLFAQERPKSPMPSPPERAGPSETEGTKTGAIARRTSLEQREGAFRQTVSRLYEKIAQLKEEVDNTQTTQIFSVKIFKETGEIEKLAKQLKNLSKT